MSAKSYLSTRELAVLTLFAQGTRDMDVASELGVAVGTVRAYRGRIEDKFRVRTMREALVVAWWLNMIELGPIAQNILAGTERFRALPLPVPLQEAVEEVAVVGGTLVPPKGDVAEPSQAADMEQVEYPEEIEEERGNEPPAEPHTIEEWLAIIKSRR